MAVDMDRARKFARLTMAKRALEAKVRQVNKDLAALEEGILDDFATEGTHSIKVETRPAANGKPAQVVSIFLREELWVNAPLMEGTEERDYAKANAWLLEHDADLETGAFVQQRFNATSVSAFARAWKQEKGELPPGMEDAFDVRGGYRASVRAS